MKKIFAILMSMMLIFTFIGCSGTEQKEEGQQDMKVTDSVQAESEEKKDTVVEKEEPVTFIMKNLMYSLLLKNLKSFIPM